MASASAIKSSGQPTGGGCLQRKIPALAESQSSTASRSTRLRPMASLDRYALGEVSRLIDVAAAEHAEGVGEELERGRDQQGLRPVGARRPRNYHVGLLLNLVVAGGGHGDHHAASGFHFLDVADRLVVMRALRHH